MAGRVYSLEEVKQHDKESDAWVVFKGDVFDVTKFIKEHPGGSSIVVPHLGTDISEVKIQIFVLCTRNMVACRRSSMTTSMYIADRLMTLSSDTRSARLATARLRSQRKLSRKRRKARSLISPSQSSFRLVQWAPTT
mmetsp:Transcript_65012/g.174568  ORF Transcript_65012/g.174568 Transcript_65012/m.174568 type:complete len:137 (-) Transcript_65012:357-767(-)